MLSDTSPVLLRRIGLRLRLLRRKLGMTQAALAASTGLTTRRLSRCEQGERPLSASELFQIGVFLGVSVTFFYEQSDALEEIDTLLEEHPELRAEAEQLVHAFNAVKDNRLRQELFDLIRTTAKSDVYSI